jgi:hypothetical protein
MQFPWLPYPPSAALMTDWNWMPRMAPDLTLRIILIPLIFHFSNKNHPSLPEM